MLEEAEDFKCGFIVYRLFESVALDPTCDLLSYNSLSVSSMKINH